MKRYKYYYPELELPERSGEYWYVSGPPGEAFFEDMDMPHLTKEAWMNTGHPVYVDLHEETVTSFDDGTEPLISYCPGYFVGPINCDPAPEVQRDAHSLLSLLIYRGAIDWGGPGLPERRDAMEVLTRFENHIEWLTRQSEV